MDDSPLAAWLRNADATAAGQEHRSGADADAPADDSEPWHDEGDPPRRRLLLLAALPWLLLAAAGIATFLRSSGGSDVHAPPPAADVQPAASATAANSSPEAAQRRDGPRVVAAPTGGPGAAGSRAGPDHVAGRDGEPGAQEAGVIAESAVRAAVTDLGTEARSYADDVAVESVSHVGPVTIVTVRVVVLDGDGAVWSQAAVRRYAVAVGATAAGPAPLAPPWPLAVPSAEATAWRLLDDDRLTAQAAEALRAAGWSRVSPPRLQRSATWPGVLRARTTAVAPGGDRPRRHEVWLAEKPRPAVLPAGGDRRP